MQADGSETYPIQEAGQDKYRPARDIRDRCRRALLYTTVLPKPYTVPYDGPVGDLLRAGNRHAWRPAHLHYMVRAEGMRSVVAEMSSDAEYVDNDAVFGVRKSLIAKVEPYRARGRPTCRWRLRRTR